MLTVFLFDLRGRRNIMGTVSNLNRQPKPATLRVQIKRIRSITRLSQREFARLVGVSPSLVQAWESGAVDAIHDDSKRLIQKAIGLTDAQVFDIFYRREDSDTISMPPDVERRLAQLVAGGANPSELWDAFRGVLSVVQPSPKRRRAA